jgi:Uma2 family endonuclease
MGTPVMIRPLTVQEYHQMAEAGILRPDERVELLDGHLFSMAAKGTAHSSATTRTRRVWERKLGDHVLIRVQEPVQLNEYSEPEPDLAIVMVDPLDYATNHPQPAQVYWLIEVSDSSLAFDCGTKATAYAKANIQEYWVLDVQDRKLTVMQSPQAGEYQSQVVLTEEMPIAPLAFPDYQVEIRDMLPLLTIQ